MVQPILVQAPDKGVNNLLPVNMIGDRESVCWSKNVLFSCGEIKTPYGFALLAESGLPLDSGSKILGIAKYQEQDKTEHIIVVTSNKIYKKNNIGNAWVNVILNDLVDNTLRANIFNPVSFVSVTHTDGIAMDVTGSEAYRHLLICDGGMSPIQRWVGKFESKFYSLKGADGYHEADTPLVTDHYALQVNLFYDHVILLSPKTWNATAQVFEENPSLVLFGKAGKLEGSDAYKTTETGAGAIDLIDTGDTNVWCAKLGNQLIVYQKHSIWSLSNVGGADVFRARVEMTDLGLLAPHLLISYDNKHFFVGNDFNIYVYYGGSTKQLIGTQIRDLFKDDLDYTLAYRCWMAVGANSSRLWIYYVPEGQSYVVKAWGMDLQTGAWMQRDFTHVWTDSGITCVVSLGAQYYMVGDTYQQAIDSEETYNDAITAGDTYRDLLQEIIVEDRLAFGDSEGNIFQYDPDLTTDNGIVIPSQFVSKVFDYGWPDTSKWWDGITVVAKGTNLVVSYRTGNFESENTGWIDFPAQALTDEYQKYSFYFNDTSTQIQFKFSNYLGSKFAIREFKVHSPTFEDEL